VVPIVADVPPGPDFATKVFTPPAVLIARGFKDGRRPVQEPKPGQGGPRPFVSAADEVLSGGGRRPRIQRRRLCSRGSRRPSGMRKTVYICSSSRHDGPADDRFAIKRRTGRKRSACSVSRRGPRGFRERAPQRYRQLFPGRLKLSSILLQRNDPSSDRCSDWIRSIMVLLAGRVSNILFLDLPASGWRKICGVGLGGSAADLPAGHGPIQDRRG